MLKYSYLPKQKNMTLSHIISKITNEFLPALHYKYVFKNFKQSELYRSYNPSIVPDYLQGRPKQTILHCLHRQASSNKFASSDIIQVSPSVPKFEVKGAKGTHMIDFSLDSGELSCSCKDWITTYRVNISLPFLITTQSGAGISYQAVTRPPHIFHWIM